MYKYGSYARRVAKARFGLIGLIQDHHIIPQQFKKNNLIKGIIHHPKNILMMPTPKGIQQLRLRKNRLVHWGPHHKYNIYVGYELDNCNNPEDVDQLLEYLKWELRFRDTIPWK